MHPSYVGHYLSLKAGSGGQVMLEELLRHDLRSVIGASTMSEPVSGSLAAFISFHEFDVNYAEKSSLNDLDWFRFKP